MVVAEATSDNIDDKQKIKKLERKIAKVEKKIQKLEKKLGKTIHEKEIKKLERKLAYQEANRERLQGELDALNTKPVTTVLDRIQEMKIMLKNDSQGYSEKEIELMLERLTISEDLAQLEIHKKTSRMSVANSNEQAQDLIKKLLSTTTLQPSPMDDVDIDESNITAKRYYPTGTYETNNQQRFDCNDEQTEHGNLSGTITRVTIPSAYISKISSYPDDVSVSKDENHDGKCDVKQFKKLKTTYRVIPTMNGCSSWFTADQLPHVGSCNRLADSLPGGIVMLVTTYAEYDDQIGFNTAEGWTFVYVG